MSPTALVCLVVLGLQIFNQLPALSQSPTSPTVSQSSGSTKLQSKACDVDFAPYMAALERRISYYWRPDTVDNGPRVFFNIHSDGTVSDLKIGQSSGKASTDQFGLDAVVKASPFEVLPKGSPESVAIDFSFGTNTQELGDIQTSSDTIDHDPNNVTAYKTRARALLSLNQNNRALADFGKAINLAPKDQEALVGRAETYMNLHDYTNALADYSRGLDLAPQKASVYADRAHAYLGLHQLTAAYEDLRKAFQLDQKSAVQFICHQWTGPGNFSEGKNLLKDCDQALSLHKEDPSAVYSLRAIANYWLAKHANTMADFARAILLKPANALALSLRANLYESTVQTKSAISDYTRVIALAPNNPSAYFERAKLYAFSHQCWLAIADYDRVIALGFNLPVAYRERAEQFHQLGQTDRALENINRAIELSPKDARSYSTRGDILARAGQYEKAMADYCTAFDLDPNSAGKSVPDCDAFFSMGGVRQATYGFIDKSGNLVIEYRFADAGKFHDGLAAVKIGESYGYINKAGKIVIPPRFHYATEFHDGLAMVIDRHANKSFIDPSGNPINGPHIDSTPALDSAFSEGLVPTPVGERTGYRDKQGKIVIKPMFDQAYVFSEGLAPAKIGGKFGFIDRTGKFVIAPQFSLVHLFSEGLAAVWTLAKHAPVGSGGVTKARIESENKCGYIDKSGKWVIEHPLAPESLDPQRFVQSSSPGESVSESSLETYMQDLRYPFDVYDPGFSQGLAVALAGNNYGYIDKTGAFAIKPRFKSAKRFSEGLAAVDLGGRWGYIDKTGKIVIPEKYASAGEFGEGLAAVATITPGGKK
jgi:tetratricopeptide (TPR) repeat protein